jgi:hypothetical protein
VCKRLRLLPKGGSERRKLRDKNILLEERYLAIH